jgi:hypothetical protein
MFQPYMTIFRYIICCVLFHCILLLLSKEVIKIKPAKNVMIKIEADNWSEVPLEVEYYSAFIVYE